MRRQRWVSLVFFTCAAFSYAQKAESLDPVRADVRTAAFD